MNLGQTIRKKRKEKGMNQTQLGKAIGVSAAAICKYEKNIIENMSRNKAIELSKILDIPPVYFIEACSNENFDCNQLTPKQFANEVRQLLDKTLYLSEAEKNLILQVLYTVCNKDI